MLKQRNNHGAAPCSNTDDRAVDEAFLQLGRVLAEIANSLQEKAEVAGNIAGNKHRGAKRLSTLEGEGGGNNLHPQK